MFGGNEKGAEDDIFRLDKKIKSVGATTPFRVIGGVVYLSRALLTRKAIKSCRLVA